MDGIDLAKMRRKNTDSGGMRNVWDHGSTHYFGCEYDHNGCAIEALCKEVEKLRALVPVQKVEMDSWIGVDLDGTLAETVDWTKGCGIGAPIPAMVDRVVMWLAEGKNVRVLTARVAVTDEFSPISNRFADEQFRDEQTVLIEAWCLDHIGTILPITCQKDFKMSELWDDRAVQVVRNTGETLEEYLFEHPTKGDDNG